MVSTINIDIGIKEPTRWYQNCNMSQGEYVKVRESLFIIWVNTILSHVDANTILPR
jgi:hypothetical protein